MGGKDLVLPSGWRDDPSPTYLALPLLLQLFLLLCNLLLPLGRAEAAGITQVTTSPTHVGHTQQSCHTSVCSQTLDARSMPSTMTHAPGKSAMAQYCLTSTLAPTHTSYCIAAHTHTHTHTHIHVYAHTHAHTHTHTSLSLRSPLNQATHHPPPFITH